MKHHSIYIAIVGLCHIGLPLVVEFGKNFDTLGFDINIHRIDELQAGHDRLVVIA